MTFSVMTRPRGNTIVRKESTNANVEKTRRVLDYFTNNKKAYKFFQTLLPLIDVRSDNIEEFYDFDLLILSALSRDGQDVIDKVEGVGDAQNVMKKLFISYISDKEPKKWGALFETAAKNAFMIKYMYREEVSRAQFEFRAHAKKMVVPGSNDDAPGKKMFEQLVEKAIEDYG